MIWEIVSFWLISESLMSESCSWIASSILSISPFNWVEHYSKTEWNLYLIDQLEIIQNLSMILEFKQNSFHWWYHHIKNWNPGRFFIITDDLTGNSSVCLHKIPKYTILHTPTINLFWNILHFDNIGTKGCDRGIVHIRRE